MERGTLCELDLSDLPGFERYAGGTYMVRVLKVKGARARVQLYDFDPADLDSFFWVPSARLAHRRVAQPYKTYERDDVVQVSCHVEGVDGPQSWWDARILREERPDYYRIRWCKKYRDYPDEEVVHRTRLRRKE